MGKQVVIVGGGLSAKHAAEVLVKAKDLQVTIIQANHFVEWPLAMTYVLSNPEAHDKALAPNGASFQVPGVAYKYGVAVSVDAASKVVALRDGSAVAYDALVVATGFAMPLIFPALGISLSERKAEIKEAGEAIRKAGTIVVAGGGLVGLELVGDIRVAYPTKRIVLTSRDKVLKQFSAETRKRVEGGLKSRNIELVTGASANAPEGVQLEPGFLDVGDTLVSYDVFLPAYSRGPGTDFLSGVPGLLDAKGLVKVNKHLQSQTCPDIFAVGVSDVDEAWLGIAKLQAQWCSVADNVKAHFAGKPLKVHKEGMPAMKLPPVALIGRGKGGWADIDVNQLPGPVWFCCCCCGKGGFPCCPPPCCWPCCGPCACGYCCAPASGEGPAKLIASFTFKSAGMHFKGWGEAAAPEQQGMA